MMKSRYILTTVLFLLGFCAFAQTGGIKGFVVDAENGQAIPHATVILKGTQRGVATNQNGYFIFNKLPTGKQAIIIRFIGYREKTLNIEVKENAITQIMVQLEVRTIELGEAQILGSRQVWESTNTISMHKLTPATIQKIPSITGSPDLADFLQVIPGIVFTGDQGGQFYIRGGAPIHNLVKFDGMTVVRPFHSIGFVSVFDTETFASADVYTAGFGAEYGGRISSVIDIRTRPGNRKNLAGKVNFTNFGYGLTLEGPLVKMTEENPNSISVLLSNKRSYIDRIDDKIYPHLDRHGIPYKYNDLYGKVTFIGRLGDQLDIIGMNNSDNADFGETMQSNWSNKAGGARFITTPKSSKWLFHASSFYSLYEGELLEINERPRETWFSSFENSFKTYSMGDIAEWEIGLNMDMYNTVHSFQGIDGITVEHEYYTIELVSYLANKLKLGKWLLEPGLHLVYYADQPYFSPEPRLKVKYDINKSLNINIATGLYSQNLLSANSDRDVVSLFQGFYMGPYLVQDTYKGEPNNVRVQQAWHGVLGLSMLTSKNLKITLEGYYKDFYKLVSYNRNRIYSDTWTTTHIPDYLKSFFLLEEGKAYGMDFLMDYNRDRLSVWLGYSLARVLREDERMEYLPHYDRRHNLNIMTGYSFGRDQSWKLKTRWNIGSGFPFTQINGVYEDFTLGYGSFNADFSENGDLYIWYSALNEGRLPWYHRLDISINKTFDFSEWQKLEFSVGIINVYNRQNMFYINRLSRERIDQYPILPNVSVKYSF